MLAMIGVMSTGHVSWPYLLSASVNRTRGIMDNNRIVLSEEMFMLTCLWPRNHQGWGLLQYWKFLRNLWQTQFSRNFVSPITVVKSFLKFCTEHGSITAVLCTKYQNVSTTGMDVMNEQYVARFRNRWDVRYCNSRGVWEVGGWRADKHYDNPPSRRPFIDCFLAVCLWSPPRRD